MLCPCNYDVKLQIIIVNRSAQLSSIKQLRPNTVLHLREAWQPWHVSQARAGSHHFGCLQRQRCLIMATDREGIIMCTVIPRHQVGGWRNGTLTEKTAAWLDSSALKHAIQFYRMSKTSQRHLHVHGSERWPTAVWLSSMAQQYGSAVLRYPPFIS